MKDSMKTKRDIYRDFKLIRRMKAPDTVKIEMLTFLLSSHENPWRVIGITKEALKVFKSHDFKKESGMGINRSHIHSRADSYHKMMARRFKNYKEWWEFYYSRDATILATSSENNLMVYSEVYEIDESKNLFTNSGYAWRHNKNETEYLKSIDNNPTHPTMDIEWK